MARFFFFFFFLSPRKTLCFRRLQPAKVAANAEEKVKENAQLARRMK